MKDLYYGGWVAENMYYMGYSGFVDWNGLWIGGISGIFKPYDFKKGYTEVYPFSDSDIKSVYHTREFEVMKVLHMNSEPIDIMLSHDWPTVIGDITDKKALLKIKPHFDEDLRTHKLGNPHFNQILKTLKPQFWCSAHLHVRWSEIIEHSDGS